MISNSVVIKSSFITGFMKSKYRIISVFYRKYCRGNIGEYHEFFNDSRWDIFVGRMYFFLLFSYEKLSIRFIVIHTCSFCFSEKSPLSCYLVHKLKCFMIFTLGVHKIIHESFIIISFFVLENRFIDMKIINLSILI